MPDRSNTKTPLSRRALLKSAGLAPLLLRAAPFWGSSFLFAPPDPSNPQSVFPFTDVRFKPHYPTKSPLTNVLSLVAPGSDEYPTEKYAFEIGSLLQQWSQSLRESIHNLPSLLKLLSPAIKTSPLHPVKEVLLRSGYGIDATKRQFSGALPSHPDQFVQELQTWLGAISKIEVAEFEIYGIKETIGAPLTVQLEIRYDIVAIRKDTQREERVGSWQTEWSRSQSNEWIAHEWEASEEILSVGNRTAFLDVTAKALSGVESYKSQMLHGADYWRTILDGACGIDLYGNNGVAAGDYDNDGFDDLYICQPAGLPNRLYRNRGDGTFEDVTEKAGVGALDNTACALFADFDNRGLQDLLVVCGSGPLLFQNQGDGTFSLKRDAFKFTNPPQGTFTHAAIADYDGDGRLDVYFCTYMYYLGLDQYHYPVPYYDARNGPPNYLLHNEGNGQFVEKTEAAGLNVDNNRYSFACAWGESHSNGLPDLCIANDFGSSQIYRNNGNGTFTVASKEAHIEDVGAGMSACWSDFNNDGRQDIYITSMWEASGQRVSEQAQFHQAAPQSIRALYQRHARGNALYRNQGDGTFQNIGQQAGVAMGRWSWSSDFWDFDHDGYSDLYVTNGYISAVDRSDIASFFWRQVVAKSPEDATPSLAYEHGWNAINELIRSDNSWNAYERNVMFANNRDGTFSEVSGVVGLDFIEDSRSFALADIDHDGRLEVILKNRNAPQLRILHNAMSDIGDSITFRLRGHKSNRDAIGAAITVETDSLTQTKYLQAGSGFLGQHSKEVFFGIGKPKGPLNATVRWPSGILQKFESLPANHRIEIEEGNKSYAAKAFVATPEAYTQVNLPSPSESLPSQVETWLISPLKAPEFSLPDLAGNMRELRQLQGNFVLLNFWATTSPICREQLRSLQQQRSKFAASRLGIVAVNIDETTNIPSARSMATTEKLSFPVLFATEEVACIYNIIYRYLFDRRRDLAIPTSFLLDANGMIVKIYQGAIDPEHVLEDARTAPTNAAERSSRAIPLKGELFQGSFQRNDFTYGVALFQHGYLDQAAESFQQVIASKPDDPEGYYNLGTLNLRRNDLSQARSYLDKALKLRPNYPEAWSNLGMINAQEGHAADAIENFERALQLRPDYEIALLNLGNIYRRQRAFGKAEEYLTHALRIQPDDPEGNYSLGMLYAQQSQLPTAAVYLQKAILIRPAYPEALNNLGIIFVRLKDYEKAEEQFRTGVRLVPDNEQSYLNLARLYTMEDKKEKAKQALQELLLVQPQNSEAKQALELLR
ncbi:MULTISPECIES: FG-GAP-like repeat-containing protein [Acidobacteriaceae]|uniref:FG-GAP-like repeat-containing protein n=1 Tax=Acidobacteriaceae TaxID=204434 RepID=UPI00131BE1A7|nr:MULTISPECIES: FG-GAP-like repeat-containing protein [Acidobacteriaceae]MDW5267660.1 FG-GAP-like repeat-containing protein [Edaphobacter sp.]